MTSAQKAWTPDKTFVLTSNESNQDSYVTTDGIHLTLNDDTECKTLSLQEPIAEDDLTTGAEDMGADEEKKETEEEKEKEEEEEKEEVSNVSDGDAFEEKTPDQQDLPQQNVENVDVGEASIVPIADGPSSEKADTEAEVDVSDKNDVNEIAENVGNKQQVSNYLSVLQYAIHYICDEVVYTVPPCHKNCGYH